MTEQEAIIWKRGYAAALQYVLDLEARLEAAEDEKQYGMGGIRYAVSLAQLTSTVRLKLDAVQHAIELVEDL